MGTRTWYDKDWPWNDYMEWYIQFIYYLLISVEIYMVAEENKLSIFLKKKDD